MIPPGLDVLIDNSWRGNAWKSFANGAAVTSDADGILTTTALNVGESAFRQFWLPVAPGTVVEVEVLARQVAGGAEGTSILFDLFEHDLTPILAGITVARVDVVGNDWKAYRLSYTVPILAAVKDAAFLRVGFGVQSAFAGDARWQLPVIRIGRGLGAPIVLARALVQVAAGVPTLHSGFPNHGIASLAFNGSTILTVTLNHVLPAGQRPLIVLTGTADQPTRIPVVNGVVGGDPTTFGISWTNGAALQNVAAGTNFVYVVVCW